MKHEVRAGFLPPMKRYVNAVERRLRLPWKVRARVMSDFATGIQARREQGQSDEQIMADLGEPARAAAELNSQMQAYVYRRSPWRFACLALAGLCAIALVVELLPWRWMVVAFSPTEPIFLTGSQPPTLALWGSGVSGAHIAVTLALMAAGLAGFFLLRRLKGRREP